RLGCRAARVSAASSQTRAALFLHAEICRSFVGQLERIRMLTAVVELLCLIELGDRRLHLRVVGLHLRGRFAAFLDHLRARARERRTRGAGQRDRYRRDCYALSHVLSPPFKPGWLWSL